LETNWIIFILEVQGRPINHLKYGMLYQGMSSDAHNDYIVSDSEFRFVVQICIISNNFWLKQRVNVDSGGRLFENARLA
jgi:hypothetical protein